MKPVWTKPTFEDVRIGAECTAYAGAQRVGVPSERPNPSHPGAASMAEPAGGRLASDGSALPRPGPAA
jgi:coenzyme PQQ precursor peptide PqqA